MVERDRREKKRRKVKGKGRGGRAGECIKLLRGAEGPVSRSLEKRNNNCRSHDLLYQAFGK